MKKIEDLVIDYIEGKEVPDIEKLENDENFMKMAIGKSNDKNLYFICGDYLKYDIDFIRYLLKKFSNDEEYAEKVLETCMPHFKRNEDFKLGALLQGLYPNSCKKNILSCILAAEVVYLYDRYNYINDKEERNIEVNDMGFYDFVTSARLNEKDIDIVNYYARMMVLDIINKNQYKFLEQLIHSVNDKKVDSQYVTDFLFEYISTYDKTLGEYASMEVSVRWLIVSMSNSIVDKWDVYNYVLEEKTYNEVSKCIKTLSLNFFPEKYEVLLYAIGNDLNLLDKFKEYKIIDEDIKVSEVMDCFLIKETEQYNVIMSIVKDILSSMKLTNEQITKKEKIHRKELFTNDDKKNN